MEQDIRFCEVDGRRVAYATIGDGPLLVFSARWITHLEDEWELTEVRSFFEELAAAHRVVRYDRIGVGLSARDLPQPPTVESEARVLRAVLDASVGEEPATVFACSCAGLATALFARDSPERVRKLVFFGGYAARDDIPEATRGSLVDFVRVNWPLAAQMLAGLFVPGASGAEIAAFSRYQRHSAEASVAAAFLACGRLNAGTPLEIASTPVSAVAPWENALSSAKIVMPATAAGAAICGLGGTTAGHPPTQRTAPIAIKNRIDTTNP